MSGPTTNVHSEFIKTENDRLTHLKTDNRLHWDQGEGDRSRHGIPTDGVRIVAPSVTDVTQLAGLFRGSFKEIMRFNKNEMI